MIHIITAMRINLLFFLVLIISIPSFSQLNLKIGKDNETVYPVIPNEINDFSELIPFQMVFDNKTIVAMGEATHGTREFFNMKAKTFKFLASRCGFRIFAIEATYGGTMKVNDYVLYGKGDVLSAMQGMEFWTWDTEEVRSLIEWMKSYNTAKPEEEKLKFYGFDCQSVKGPTNALIDYVREYDNAKLNEFIKTMSVLNDSNYRYFYTIHSGKSSVPEITKLRGIISSVQKWFNGNEDHYIAASGKKKFELARYNIEALKQAIMLRGTPESEYNRRRDSCMAQNILWLSGTGKEKMFVWAHNGHICKSPNPFEMRDQPMGMYLDSMFGTGYYAIGFEFNKGSFRALNPKTQVTEEYSVPEYKKNNLTNILAKTGEDAFFIDLKGSCNKLFTTHQSGYYIGAVFIPALWERYSKKLILKKQFDGLIFVNSTSSAVAINRDLTN